MYDLRTLILQCFCKSGEVLDVRLFTNKRYAFVSYATRQNAEVALKEVDALDLILISYTKALLFL